MALALLSLAQLSPTQAPCLSRLVLVLVVLVVLLASTELLDGFRALSALLLCVLCKPRPPFLHSYCSECHLHFTLRAFAAYFYSHLVGKSAEKKEEKNVDSTQLVKKRANRNKNIEKSKADLDDLKVRYRFGCDVMCPALWLWTQI